MIVHDTNIKNDNTSQTRLRIPSATEKHTKKQLGFRAFSNSAPKLWNALPRTIREADSSATFRRRIKTHLLSECLFIFSVCWTHWAPKPFLCLPKTFFCSFSIHYLLQRTEHSSQWNHALQKWPSSSSLYTHAQTAENKIPHISISTGLPTPPLFTPTKIQPK